ncbi:MAG: toll/interleukin-1 receptor domain-containing protein [Bacteroidetes bacterium]|nr:MAG: toll/interleukin-1 receptor domain-containing protein [Bacteroidota bacterium]
MKHKYQLIILGSYNGSEKEITDLFINRLDELKLQKEFYQILYSRNFEKEYEGNQPSFTIYIGNDSGNFNDLDKIERLLNEGNIILPLFFNSFSVEIPKILENQNGLKYLPTEKDKVVNLILESFGKLRNTRKVFVSYRRDESSSVAIQLYEALERNNFDVFLDTHSIKQGEPFQDELWHRMTDCDVIVLLNTKNFLESKWCKEEIAEASVKQIGVLQLVWPNHTLEKMAEVCIPINLKPEGFVENNFSDKDLSKLTQERVLQIVQQTESLRARNLAARQDSLITNFLSIAKKYGKKMSVQPQIFITEDVGVDKRRIFIPSVGIPLSTDYNQSSELKKEIQEYAVDEVYLIYDNVRIREKWLKHLDYLNEWLDVETIKKQEFEVWLKNN